MTSARPDYPRRRSIRLRGDDYSRPGAYFITICTSGRLRLFGDVVDDEMKLNNYGQIVEKSWLDLGNHYPGIGLDAFVVMPNHVHGVLAIADQADTKRMELSEIVRGLKSYSAKSINQARGLRGAAVWQRNYCEHVIRNERELSKVREYIGGNPAKWSEDVENPKNLV